MIFSNKSKFCILGMQGRKLVWRKQNIVLNKENLVSTVEHGGGGVLLWRCMVCVDV